MTELLASHPEYVRLLKSGQSALPLREDFWPVLAHGVGLSVDQLGGALRDLYERGIVRGMAGEPNVASPHYHEILSRSAPERHSPFPIQHHTRWRPADGRPGWTSFVQEKRGPSGVRATRWFKVGFFADFSLPNPENLLGPNTDRSLLEGDPVRRDEAAAGSLPAPACLEAVRSYLDEPRALLPPESPWRQACRALASTANATESDVRAAVAHLVVARQWRRFAWRLDFAAMGWQGCGVAGWRIADAEGDKAAQALARVAGSGDVALRIPTPEFPCNLTAVLVGREAGAGQAAAKRIGEQWGHAPVFWQDVDLG